MRRPTDAGRHATVLAAALFLGACGGGSDAARSAAEDGSALRVALLTAGPVSDAGWYAGAYEGLMMIADSLGAEVSHQQTSTPAEFDEAFLSYGSAGYDLVFAHGAEYTDAAMRAGPRFPDMTIVVSGGGRFSDNVTPLVFQLEEGTYLAGMLAGGMSESGTIGMVGGVAIPPVQGTFMAFEAGVLAVAPDARVLETYVGNWDDVAAAKEATVAQLSRGADVVIHNMDGGSFGIFQAVREAAASRTAWAIGMNRDQNDVAPDVILGSAVIRIPEAFLVVARRWSEGSLGAGPIYTGAEAGIIDFVLNPELAGRVPAELVQRIDETRGRIRAGELDVPRVPFVSDTPG